jgi:hypothetical protein
MELFAVSSKIQEKINLLEAGRKELYKRSQKRAEKMANYEKVLGITILKLKNNAIKDYDGMSCENLPATILEKVAKSMVWSDKLEVELAETKYKNAVVGLNCLESEMNGYQSIQKYQTEIGG